MSYASLSYQWLGPGILVSMGAAFLLMSLHDQKRRAALYLAGAYLVVAIGYTQILLVGGDLRRVSLMVALSSALVGYLLLVRGISRLYRRRFPILIFGLLTASVAALIYWFHGEPSLIWLKVSAVYGAMAVLDVVCGIIAWRAKSHRVDCAIAIIFIGQALLTVLQLAQLYMPGAEPLSMASFGSSAFVVTLRTTNGLFGIILGIALFVRFGVVEVQRLTLLAGTDSLTGLLNRRAFETAASALRASASPLPTGLIFCDIDHFKRVNDCHGHDAGDRALKAFAKLLITETPDSAVCARLGGEEFCILLAVVDGEMTRLQATQLRIAVERFCLVTKTGSLKLTASFGYCELASGGDLRVAMAAVDAAVYQAKSDGRNLVREAKPVSEISGEGGGQDKAPARRGTQGVVVRS